VLAAADKLGYRANPAAAALASQRKGVRKVARRFNLACLSGSADWKDAVWRGVDEGAREFGYGLEKVRLTGKLDAARLGRKLWNSGVEGLIVSVGHDSPEFDWPALGLERFALVRIGRVLPQLPVAMVRASVVEMVKCGLDAIFARGYRAVWCVVMSTPSQIDDDIRLGSLYAYRERHLPAGARLEWDMLADPQHYQRRPDALRARLDAVRPDAVLAFPWSLIFDFTAAGLRIPADLAFAAMPVPETGAGAPDGLTVAGVSARRAEQGRRAVHRLHQLILSGQRGIPPTCDQTLVEPVWTDGATLQGPGRG
jgi:DNA-binding LacI/PurR family transcriptional regulator